MPAIHHELDSGTRIDCYEIGKVLGVGGFGITYKGYDHTLSCDVAIKEYLPSGVALRTGDGVTVVPKSDQDQDFYSYGLDRFLEEARILAKFREQSIVRVTRFLEGNGTAYLIMDYEDGQPLNSFLKSQNTLDEGRVMSILLPLLNGLKEVHLKGYLHRDIKPANIYLRQDGTPVLLDFGAARQSMGDRTQAVTSMVTPGYAPIEQYNTTGKQGPWTDFYGLGATLYRSLFGKIPVGAPDRIMALQAGDPDPLLPAVEQKRIGISDTLLELVDWMLKPNIADRPDNVDAILANLGIDSMGKPSSFTVSNGSANTHGISTDSGLNSPTQWRREELEAVTQELASYIGPMAKVLVKEASTQTYDISTLCEKLAESISSETGKSTFLRSIERHTLAQSSNINTGPPSQPSGRQTRNQSGASLTRGPDLTDEIIVRAEKKLAGYIGPLAKTIVRKNLGQSADARQFIALLANEIDNIDDRNRFIKDMKL